MYHTIYERTICRAIYEQFICHALLAGFANVVKSTPALLLLP
jgi:hypothetical protein